MLSQLTYTDKDSDFSLLTDFCILKNKIKKHVKHKLKRILLAGKCNLKYTFTFACVSFLVPIESNCLETIAKY